MEDYINFFGKWKTTSSLWKMENDLNLKFEGNFFVENGRRLIVSKMEDDHIYFKSKMTYLKRMEDNN
jgi:hypothetical protein